jgi:hypothetical protein
MKIFMDSEFIERPGTIELISLGLVTEDGREYYAQSWEFDAHAANPWVQEHVLPQLDACKDRLPQAWHQEIHPVEHDWWCPWQSHAQIRRGILDFVGTTTPEFWTYYGAYDWVAWCWLFGAMVDLPQGWPMYAYDLRQWLDHRGLGHVTQPDDMPHHALSDARWVRQTYLTYARQEKAR